jgi:hypothetical protein
MQYHSIGKVCWGSHGTTAPLAPCEPRQVNTTISHSSEQDTLSTTSWIIKQSIPYRTRGSTCCPGVSTPKTQSLADSSLTNHKPWRSQSSPPFETLLKPQHRISSRLPHIMTNRKLTLSILNIIKMERLVWWLKTAGLSNTTNHKNSILKSECLGNQLMHAACVY